MGKLGFISLLVAVLAVLFGERVYNLRKRLLATRELVKNHLPNCVLLKDLEHGTEDITILGDGLAFISAGLRYPGFPSSDEPGKIFVLDLKDSRMEPKELRMPRNFNLETFSPLGISLYTDPSDDAVYLFVVNRPHPKCQIEVFKFVEEELSLVHLKTIKHELLRSINNILAVGVDSFYATNDHYFENYFLQSYIEMLLCQPWGNVMYYSPTEVKEVSQGYYMANGINISPDKRHIYVSDVFDHNVHVLERKEDNALTRVKTVAVGSLVDNIEVDPETGDLWVGCHPNGFKLFYFDPNDPAGSEVVRIQNIHSDKPQNMGQRISPYLKMDWLSSARFLKCLHSLMSRGKCTFWICCIRGRAPWSCRSKESWTSVHSIPMGLAFTPMKQVRDKPGAKSEV